MIKTDNKSIVVVIGAILIVTTVFFLFGNKEKSQYQDTKEVVPLEEKVPLFILQGGSVPFEVSIADSEEERLQGLSGTSSLPPNTGKLFIFENPGIYGFWMKDMNFPIDIVWIDESFAIVGINEGATPESFPEVFFPPKAVQYVLEINSGASRENNLSVGTILKLLEK
jgi:uncharacterized membrane protein (UPF0127 family)